MPASFDSLLTSLQNAVQGLSNIAQSYMNVQGVRNTADISAATLVRSGAGRLCAVSITVAGANGAVYDTNDVTSTARLLFVIPNTLGIVFVNLPVGYGIVVVPGAGQTVAVSWS